MGICKEECRPQWYLKLSGHNSRDRSECVKVIGVNCEPFAVNGRK